jgi:hypothetical protein
MGTRTRKMPLDDWVEHSANWRHRTIIRFPPNPQGTINTDQSFKGNLAESNAARRGQKVTSDESHGFSVVASLQDGKFDGDRGGSFLSTTSFVQAEGSEQFCWGAERIINNWVENYYHGPVFAVDPRQAALPVGSLMKNLGPMGTHAIAECKPTNNVADLAVDLSEIARDGLPALLGAGLWKDKTHAAHKAGGEYLNLEFGWKPLVGSVRDASYAAANAHRLLSSYERNSGKIVRRRFDFPVEKSEVTELIGPSEAFFFAPQTTSMFDTSKPIPQLYRTTKRFYRAWFSGAFTYHLPIGYKSRNALVSAAAKAGPLLGIELTPETVWNATPWTWALNWFSNAGDVVSNLSDWAVDGLVLKWGYMMEHTLQQVTYTLVGTPRQKPYGLIYASPVTSWLETKKRVRATPFGFETTWNLLSPRQLAISAALGLTRFF